MVEEDWAYVISSFIGSYHNFGITGELELPPRHFFRFMRGKMTGLRDLADIHIACDPEDKNLILGWSCTQGPILHYLYVKRFYRKQGLGVQLLAPLAGYREIYCAHWTPLFEKFSRNKPQLYRRITC
jgi:GNAT superfamily N-acetyltransferase